MKRLLDLPNELLDQITEHVPASMLSGLASACRCLYSLTKDRRLAHIYGEISFADRGPPGWFPKAPGSQIDPLGFRRSPLLFLDLIIALPYVATYSTCFEYKWNRHCYCPLRVAQMWRHVCDKRCHTPLEEKVVCLLLASLPNLESITFHRGQWAGSTARTLRRALIMEMPALAEEMPSLTLQMPGLTLETAALAVQIPKLNKVSTFRYYAGTQVGQHDFSDDMLVMMHAALLPSMEKLYGSDLYFQQSSHGLVVDPVLGPWLLGMRSSAVTSINFSFGAGDETAATIGFLRMFKGLLSVKLCSKQFGGFAGIKEALLCSASSSLQVLDLRTFGQWDPVYLGSFTRFKQLKSISVNYTVFIDGDGVVHPLVGMLPASIQELHLRDVRARTVMCSHIAGTLFIGLPELKSVLLPKLGTVSSTTPIPSKIKSSCKAFGVSIIYNRCYSEKRAAGWGPDWPCTELYCEEYDTEDLR